MIDKLIGAVAENIRKAVGEKFEVYTESVYQYAVKPCFFVECENVERIEMLNNNYFVRVHAKIICENDGDEKRLETESVATKLLDLLSTVMVDPVRLNGRKIHGKWEDGRLVIRAIYDIWHEMGTEEHDLMESIEVKGIYDGVGIHKG